MIATAGQPKSADLRGIPPPSAFPEQKHIEIWILNEDSFQLLGRFSRRRFASSKLLPGFKVRVDQMLADSLEP